MENAGYLLKKVKKVVFLRHERQRELSSVGSEHRPYKAGVIGSSPIVPTKKWLQTQPFLVVSYQLFSCQLMVDHHFTGNEVAVVVQALQDVKAVA